MSDQELTASDPQLEQQSHHNGQVTQRAGSVGNNTRNLAGILLIILGVYFLLDNLNIFRINLVETITTWWPMVFIYFGFEQLAKHRPIFRTLWYVIFVAFVVYLLMSGFF